MNASKSVNASESRQFAATVPHTEKGFTLRNLRLQGATHTCLWNPSTVIMICPHSIRHDLTFLSKWPTEHHIPFTCPYQFPIHCSSTPCCLLGNSLLSPKQVGPSFIWTTFQVRQLNFAGSTSELWLTFTLFSSGSITRQILATGISRAPSPLGRGHCSSVVYHTSKSIRTQDSTGLPWHDNWCPNHSDVYMVQSCLW
jgi:hypothetical protein